VTHEGAVDEAEVHDAGLHGKVETVAVAEAWEAVGALKKFVADCDAPLGGKGCNIGDFLQMEVFGVVTADDHSESVFKAEGLGNFEVEALGVELLDAIVDSGGVAGRRLVEDGGEGGAGVFDIKVELAGLESFVDEERAAEVGLADDGDAGAGFDVLSEEFGEDNLFGEELGADGDFRLRRMAASYREVEEVKETKEGKEWKQGATRL
jgi:hypothetical protein